MIIDSMTLHNFGVFAGEHQLHLAPAEPSRPVTLIGGLNGAGKTTVLEALQIGLYGKGSPAARASSSSYERFLRSRISRLVPASDGASVELRIRAHDEGSERVIAVRRAWSVRNSTLREDVSVLVDDVPDRFLSENWDDASDRVFPARLASLFFFDGERIEALAHPDSSRDAIRTAVETLLGLDAVRQLESDLGTLTRMKLRNKVDTAKDRTIAETIGQLESQLVALGGQIASLVQKGAALQNDLDVVQLHLAQEERRLELIGGRAFENRHQIEERAAAVRAQRVSIEERLRRLAEGDLPLALLRGSLSELLDGLQLAKETAAKRTVNEALRANRDALIALLSAELPHDDRAVRLVENFFDVTLSKPIDDSSTLPVPMPGAESRLNYLRELLPPLTNEVSDLLRLLDERVTDINEAERALGSIPDEVVVQSALERRERLKEELRTCVQDQLRVVEALERARTEQEKVKAKLDREVQEQAAQLERVDAERRVISYANRARKTLDLFRNRLLQRQLDRLSQAVLERFRHLTRKQRLVSRIVIGPDDFSLDLFDDQDEPLAPDRLSAGERQLLAVALLWALSRASGRALPVIVDTPLGRLDSKHRRKMVERYMPSVSHQTIVLSTDEEVDDRLFQVLGPHISQSYLLKFEDDLGHSVVVPGYFGTTSR